MRLCFTLDLPGVENLQVGVEFLQGLPFINVTWDVSVEIMYSLYNELLTECEVYYKLWVGYHCYRPEAVGQGVLI